MRKLILASAVVLLVAAAGCGDQDPFGPQPWLVAADSAQLFSLDRPEYVGRSSAFDFVFLFGIPVEAPGSTDNWDIALTEGAQGLRFTPAGAFPGLVTRPGIAIQENLGFDAIQEVPAGLAFTTDASLAVRTGVVYLIRTRQYADFGRSCVRYAKMEVLEANTAVGTIRFRYIRNPNCSDRTFTSPG